MGNSLGVQWLGLQASTAGGPGSIPGQGTKILHAPQHSQKKKKKLNKRDDVKEKRSCLLKNEKF